MSSLLNDPGRIEVLGGLTVVVNPVLPVDPTPGEDARRIVRHAYGEEFLAWIGEKVGPEPGAPTHILRSGGTIHMSERAYRGLVAYRNLQGAISIAERAAR